MDLSIIIVNWNSKALLRACLLSLKRPCLQPACEILVVDNASYDGTAEMLAREFPEVTFIQSDRNLGFAAANNLAARRAHGQVLLFLNPDTEVVDDAIVRLLSGVRGLPKAGIVGARLLNSDRTLQTSCVQSFPAVINQVLDSELLRRLFPESGLWGIAPLQGTPTEPVAVEAVSGACLMIKRGVFERVGGFDERYFMYSEDLDLSFKVHQAGYRCYCVPAAEVVHHGGGSSQSARSAFSVVMMRESIYRFMRIRRGPVQAALFRLALGLSAVLRIPLVFSLRWVRDRAAGSRASTKKWIAILRWSLGLERWVRRTGLG